MEAARKGADEIFFAVVSTTIVLAAVFLPVLFLTGITGRLFREFGIVVAGSVLISAFVSLTLTPMMCSRLLKRSGSHGWFYRVTEPFFERVTAGYQRSLQTFLDRRWQAWVLVAIKRRTGEKSLWARLIGSTVVGEFGDTLLFCIIAAPVIDLTSFSIETSFTALAEVTFLPPTG